MGKIQPQSLLPISPSQFTTLSEDIVSDMPFLPQGLEEQEAEVEFTPRKTTTNKQQLPSVTQSQFQSPRTLESQTVSGSVARAQRSTSGGLSWKLI